MAVRHALEWDVLVPDRDIASTVSGGVVTLEGRVATWAQRQDAERAVRRLTGIKGVVNHITVAASQVDPLELKRRIESALERQAEREGKRIGVTVRDGVVTLTGVVRSWGEKNAIERVAMYAPGVRGIDDQTSVDPYQ